MDELERRLAEPDDHEEAESLTPKSTDEPPGETTGTPAEPALLPILPPTPRLAEPDVQTRLTEFRNALGELSAHHIFQWSTYYRDWLTRDLDWFLLAGERYSDYQGLLEQVHGSLRDHSAEIFLKGYEYQLEQQESKKYIIEKSLNGLQRFLNLSIEFYSAKLPSAVKAPAPDQQFRPGLPAGAA
jgi:hypothetical protein